MHHFLLLLDLLRGLRGVSEMTKLLKKLPRSFAIEIRFKTDK
jgi:hypothetical protein